MRVGRPEPRPKLERLRRRARQLRRLVRPGTLRYPEYFLMRLGLARFFWSRHVGPGGLDHIEPGFLQEECQPLTDPPFVPAEAAEHMRPDDLVLGVEVNGDARAYPWWIMDNHHLANDTVGGRPLFVMLCETCSTGIAFDPVINGRRFTFEQRHVYNGTPTFDDHLTGSVWSPYLGMAIRGRMTGTRLRVLPLQHMTWSAWRDLYPKTRVLAGHLGSREGHSSGTKIGDPSIAPFMRDQLARWDTRLPHNTLVLGVIAGAHQRVYPLDTLRARKGVVSDDLGGQPIVVFLNMAEGSYGALAYSRVVNGRVLTFEPDPQGPIDAETGSRWTTEGRAVAGPLAGTALDFITSHVSEWFPWAAHYAEIEIYQ